MRFLVVATMLAIASVPAHADVELWTELGVKLDLGRRVAATFDQQLRFDADVSRVGAVMPELGLRVQIAKWLRTGGGYRFEYERDGDGELVVRHRFEIHARARTDIGRLRIELDGRLQEQLRPGAKNEHRHLVRDRLDASWRGLKPWIPLTSLTLFHPLDGGGAIDKAWITVGGAHLRGPREFEVFYRLEWPIRDPNDPMLHIVGAAFHTDL